MKSVGRILLLAVLLGAVACPPAHTQSEFLGERFPYLAFDLLPKTPITVGGGTLNVGFAPGKVALPQSALLGWIENSAKAASVYFGKFPVASAGLLIVPAPGGDVQGGSSFGFRGAAIRLVVGSDATESELRDDWVAVHEMTHLALPDIREPYLWLAEGIATYVEPIARVQAGQLTAETIWADMVRDMPKGLPERGDRGLDRTPSWGRTYWGGAMFCLLADIAIRKRTGNKKGLQQALRGIVAAGGTIDQDWTVTRIFSVGDKATGTAVLADLYKKMRDKPYAPDLDALWRDLGVSVQGGGVTFDDNARSRRSAAPSLPRLMARLGAAPHPKYGLHSQNLARRCKSSNLAVVVFLPQGYRIPAFAGMRMAGSPCNRQLGPYVLRHDFRSFTGNCHG